MDYELPDIDGIGVAALLRATRPSIKIVMLSGRDLEAAMVSTGILDGYISKAAPVEQFLRATRDRAMMKRSSAVVAHSIQ